jgi:hypothetical protein
VKRRKTEKTRVPKATEITEVDPGLLQKVDPDTAFAMGISEDEENASQGYSMAEVGLFAFALFGFGVFVGKNENDDKK